MGHRKLKKFKENESFACLIQPSADEVLDKSTPSNGLSLKPHPIKGNWNKEIFDAPRPIVLELGCGRGEYTIDLAKRNPNYNYIGVDIKGARLWQGAKYATENGMRNVAFLRTRIEFIEAFFAENEVSEIWLTFSDPQIKSENSRLSSPVFLERYSHFLAKGGIVNLKTDSQFLYHYTLETVNCNKFPILATTDNLYSSDKSLIMESRLPEVLGKDAADAVFEVQTYYEKMFLAEGLPITFLSFCLDHSGPYSYPDWDEDFWKKNEGGRRTFSHRSRSAETQSAK